MAELLKFRNKNTVPPGGYAYQDPDTDHLNIAGSFDQLVRLASLHRKANDLEVEGKRECPDLRFDGGCSMEEKDLKEKYRDALYQNYYEYTRSRDNTYPKQQMELNKEIDKTKKELVDYIQEKKVPKFLEILQNFS